MARSVSQLGFVGGNEQGRFGTFAFSQHGIPPVSQALAAGPFSLQFPGPI
jgi:hypothetical protein